MTEQLEIILFKQSDANLWDDVVRRSEAGCLLFERAYMDYHADRFADLSLIASMGGRPIGVFPASCQTKTVTSHGGLTFGSWQYLPGLDIEVKRRVLQMTLNKYSKKNADRLIIRETPPFFNFNAVNMDANNLNSACIQKLDGSAIDLESPEKIGVKRRPRVNKALLTHEFSRMSAHEFWPLLEDVLSSRHGAKPTHSLEEIVRLQSRFPERILLYKANSNGRLAAGAVVYLSRDVAHIQYMATNDLGRNTHALDGLIVWLMRLFSGKIRWLSLGTSNESDGSINQGLLDYKLSFGARHFHHVICAYDLSHECSLP